MGTSDWSIGSSAEAAGRLAYEMRIWCREEMYQSHRYHQGVAVPDKSISRFGLDLATAQHAAAGGAVSQNAVRTGTGFRRIRHSPDRKSNFLSF